jgi:hypothetical protein
MLFLCVAVCIGLHRICASICPHDASTRLCVGQRYCNGPMA